MKKGLTLLLCALGGALVGILLFVFITRVIRTDNNNIPSVTLTETDSVSSGELADLAFQIADAIKANDFEKLAEHVHPEYGVVFSPYATVNLSSNQCFTSDEVKEFGSNSEQYVWGLTSDGGQLIQMGISDYFSRYVFNYDYTVAPLIGVNYIIRSGNSIENVGDTFPGAQFVDLCYPGTSGSENQDWSTLRLVFEEYGGRFMLSAIIHSEYTI